MVLVPEIGINPVFRQLRLTLRLVLPMIRREKKSGGRHGARTAPRDLFQHRGRFFPGACASRRADSGLRGRCARPLPGLHRRRRRGGHRRGPRRREGLEPGEPRGSPRLRRPLEGDPRRGEVRARPRRALRGRQVAHGGGGRGRGMRRHDRLLCVRAARQSRLHAADERAGRRRDREERDEALRRLRGDRAVQLSAGALRRHDLGRAAHRQRRGLQAVAGLRAHRAAARRDAAQGGPARRRLQHRARRRRGRAAPRLARRHRRRRLHRLARHRHEHLPRHGDAAVDEAGGGRDGRQEPGLRHPQRRSQPRRAGRRPARPSGFRARNARPARSPMSTTR